VIKNGHTGLPVWADPWTIVNGPDLPIGNAVGTLISDDIIILILRYFI